MNLPSGNQQFKRVLIALLAGLAVVTLLLLSASLADVEFKPAQQFFAPDEQQPFVYGLTTLVENMGDISLGEALILVGGILLLFVLFLMMLSPEARKRLIKTILRVGLTAWAIYYALTKFRPQGITELEAQIAAMEQASQVVVTPPPYTPPVIPSTIIYIVSFAIVLTFVGVGFIAFRLLRPSKRPFQNLARVARSALKELSSGRNWEDTVISCYIRMGAAVGEQRGLFRQSAMTPTEFAKRLEQSGLPSEPVRRLTRLFEKARYSGHSSNAEDVNEAVACLSSILLAVGEQP